VADGVSDATNCGVDPQGRAVLSHQPALDLYKLCGLALVHSRALPDRGYARRCGLDPATNGLEPVSACPSRPLYLGAATVICVFASITHTTFCIESAAWPSRLETVIIPACALRCRHAERVNRRAMS